MLALFSLEVLIVFTILVLICAMFVMLVVQLRSTRAMNKLTYPAYEFVIRQAEHKADEIISLAKQEARTIVVEAEKSGQETMGLYAESAKKAHDTFTSKLDQFTGDLTQHVTSVANASIEKLEETAAHAAKTIESSQSLVTDGFVDALHSVEGLSSVLETKTSDALSEMKSSIANASAELTSDLKLQSKTQQEHIATLLNNALKNAEADIVEYQKARMMLLDTHIERLVEDVTRKVLHKQLTLDEHAELARLALSEAKEHNLL